MPTRGQLETMSQATQALIDSGHVGYALKAGDTAPEFTLPDAEGAGVSSRAACAGIADGDLLSRCLVPELQRRSPGAGRSSARDRGTRREPRWDLAPDAGKQPQVAARQQAGVPILSDAGTAVAAKFGLRFSLPEDLIKVYRQVGADLAEVDDDPSGVLPMPARYVIETDGAIASAEVNPDYTRRPDPSGLLPVLDRLRASLVASPCQSSSPSRSSSSERRSIYQWQ